MKASKKAEKITDFFDVYGIFIHIFKITILQIIIEIKPKATIKKYLIVQEY